ncbi:hypothetical protein FB45DRAFT_442350 [Roridomyces roridus]|uniref:F-box domain-containing protein n=1 Tax=Roridomyces roridus TaxID=1738132 RepID=A0AAD7B153_9AGAR|nr:hypothetical protein FB45DRAFT_442350 [Roridomyces roridus]
MKRFWCSLIVWIPMDASLALQEEMTALRATISPFRRLPGEVLSRIFLASLADALSSPSYRSDDVLQPPNMLAHVCSAWRTVALETPELWCTIRLPDLETLCDMENPSCIPTFAERSRRLPIDFQISVSCHRFLGLWLAAIWPISERLESLTVSAPVGYLQPLVCMTSHMFPALQTLDLEVHQKPSWTHNMSAEWDLVERIDAFRTARSLSVVRLSGAVRLAPQQPLPWAQLTELQLHCNDELFTARQILSLCVALETLSLECCSSVGPTIDIPNCVLPKMRSVSLKVPDFARFFQPFSVPGLRELTLVGKKELTAGEINSFIQLHSKSRFELHSLTILRLSFAVETLIPFLHRTWSLKGLHLIDSVSADKNLFGILTYSGEPGMHMLLPDLEELTIVHTPSKYVAALKTMLESRWWGDEDGRSTEFSASARLGKVVLSKKVANVVRGKVDASLGRCIQPHISE